MPTNNTHPLGSPEATPSRTDLEITETSESGDHFPRASNVLPLQNVTFPAEFERRPRPMGTPVNAVLQVQTDTQHPSQLPYRVRQSTLNILHQLEAEVSYIRTPYPPTGVVSATLLRNAREKFLEEGVGELDEGTFRDLEDECGICKDTSPIDARADQRVVKIKLCGHVLHRHCLLKWLVSVENRDATCPYCRRVLYTRVTPRLPAISGT